MIRSRRPTVSSPSRAHTRRGNPWILELSARSSGKSTLFQNSLEISIEPKTEKAQVQRPTFFQKTAVPRTRAHAQGNPRALYSPVRLFSGPSGINSTPQVRRALFSGGMP
jgi:hypothetical protein